MYTPNYRMVDTEPRFRMTPAAAIYFQNKRGNGHEVELSSIDVRNTIHGETIPIPSGGGRYLPEYRLNTIDIAVRYEYIIQAIKKQDARLRPAIGFAAMPYFSSWSAIPYNTTYQPLNTRAIGVKTFLVPRLQIKLTPRLLADVNIPICLTDIGNKWQRIKNPSVPEYALQYSIIDAQAGPRYFSARVGLGLRI